jgi:hypothetical protein
MDSARLMRGGAAGAGRIVAAPGRAVRPRSGGG